MNFSIVLYFFFAGFLTLPTAYVTGNPVECVIHPEIWNKSKIWDPQAVGQIYEDQYEEEYVGYPIESVSTTYINIIIVWYKTTKLSLLQISVFVLHKSSSAKILKPYFL